MESKIILEGLYDSAWIQKGGRPCVVLFCRNDAGEKQIGFSGDFYPYIYLDANQYALNKSYLSQYVRKIEEATTPFIFDPNKKLLKVYLHSPSQVYKVKRDLEESYESDVPFTNRYIIDKVDELKPGKNKIAYVDIETTSESSFPNYRNPIEAITTIGLYDNLKDRYYQWIWHESFVNKLEKKEDDNRIINYFKNEKDMLNSFLDKFQELSPDYFVAWNVSFDINYICARLERLNLPWNKLSPLFSSEKMKRVSPDTQLVRWQEGRGLVGKRIYAKEELERNIRILGLQWFDLLSAYRFLIRDERPSWKLDDVAQKELGFGKTIESRKIGEIWKADPVRVLNYNFNDVLLIKKLDDKLKIIEYFKTIKDLVFLSNINDTLSSGRIIDNYMLKKFHTTYIFPSKKYTEVKADVAGGFVRDPIVGVHKNVAVFDFAGCYPNIIKTFNLSPDVFINEIIHFNDNNVDEKDSVELFNYRRMFEENGKKITYKIRTDKYQADLIYDLSKKGLLIKLIDELVVLRKKAKKEANKYDYGSREHDQWTSIEQSYKPIINGIFGVCGFSGFRLYNNATANAITAFARMLSKYVGQILRESNYEIIGSDTDSLFLKLKSVDLNENLEEINKKIFPIINKAIADFAEIFLPEEYRQYNTLTMDCEKIYESLLFLDVKKRYIGILKYYKDKAVDRKIHYMGLDLKKSNVIEVSKTAQLDVALALLNENDMIENIMIEKYKKVLDSNDINDFKTSSKLEKAREEYKSNTPAVRASLWANKFLNKNYGTNSKFYIIWIMKKNKTDNDVVAFDEPEDLKEVSFKIDKDHYMEDVYNKIDNIVRGLPKFKKMNDNIFAQYKHRTKGLKEFM